MPAAMTQMALDGNGTFGIVGYICEGAPGRIARVTHAQRNANGTFDLQIVGCQAFHVKGSAYGS